MNSQNIGSFLQKLRKEHNLTQKDISKLCNVSTQAVSKWERGESIPDIEILEKLSILYKLSINELVNGEKQELFLDIDKRRNIIALTSSILVFFAYLFSFMKFEPNSPLWIYQILKGYEVIFDGVGGELIVMTWIVFMILVSHLILNIFVLTKVVDQTRRVYSYFVFSASLGILITIFSITIDVFILLPQFIILICLLVIIFMNYKGQYKLDEFKIYISLVLEKYEKKRIEIKKYRSLRKNNGDISRYLINNKSNKNVIKSLKIVVVFTVILSLLLGGLFIYSITDALTTPNYDGDFEISIFYVFLFTTTGIIAAYSYKYIPTVFYKMKLGFLAVLLVTFPTVFLMMSIIFKIPYSMGVVVPTILAILSLSLFWGSNKLSNTI